MDKELVFYGAPRSRAITAFWMLEELGAPYEHRVLDLEANERKQPPYLAVNPMGKVPAIVLRGVAIAEPALVDRMFSRPEGDPSALGWGGYDAAVVHVAEGVRAAEPWLLGERFTAADVVIGADLIWGMMGGSVQERPEFAAYASRLRARPALQRVFEQDAALAQAQGGDAAA